MGRYVPTEWVRTVSTYWPSGYVMKEAGEAQHNTAQHSTAQHNTTHHSTRRYTTEGTADSRIHGTHGEEVGKTQEDTTRPTEGKEQVQGATGHRLNATTN